jgi:cytochrome c
VADWMRNWIFAVHLDENQNFKRMDPFMETNGDFRRPIDIKVGNEGSLYMLEYGTVYGIDNVDARLVKVDYNGGNRAPVAKIDTRDTIGMAPYKVAFNQKSFDFDEGDKLSYEWRFDGKIVASRALNPTYTFKHNGVYRVTLKVTDDHGKSSMDAVKIVVGNTLPRISISTDGNSSFFTNNPQSLKYKVDVKDDQDKIIDRNRVKVMLNYIAKVENGKALIGHQEIAPTYSYGKEMIAASDCKACHQVNAVSVGPAFMRISKRYAGKKDQVNRLADKIIKGGNGVWGEHAMSAHPQLSKQNATEIVKYILSLSTPKNVTLLPQQGTVALKEHMNNKDEGRYVLSASYTDKGGKAAPPLTSNTSLVLRPAKVQAEDADQYNNIAVRDKDIGNIHNKSFFVLKNIDLKGINQLTYRYASANMNGTAEVHVDSPTGNVISTLNFTPTGKRSDYAELSTAINDPGTKHDLYFVFVNKSKPRQSLLNLDWINFDVSK